MYNFVDTIEHTSESILPSEAMQFNGDYIEELIDGYRTLYVKGRDVLSPEIEVGEVGIRDGSYLKNKRFPARIITIGYQLLADDEEAFRTKFNALNDILNTEDAELIFRDEDDKYFIGTPNGYADVPEGRNNITSEFEIICADPFKYSVTEYEVTPTADDGKTFVVNYAGTYPAYPTLEADFYQSDTPDNTDGDCGYIAFVNDRGNVLQFGKPDETDEVANEVQEIITTTTTGETTISQSKRLLTEKFEGFNIEDWEYAGYISQPDVNKRSGDIAFTNYGTYYVLEAAGYGSTNVAGWHGPTACKIVAAPPAISGASNPTRSGNCSLSFKARFAPVANEANAKKSRATLQAYLLDSSGAMIAGIQVWKNGGTLKGSVRCYVRGAGTVKTWNKVDLSRYNKYFGYAKGNTKPNLGVTIQKQGGKFSFNVGGLTFTYTRNSLANVVAYKVSFYFGKWKAEPVVDTVFVTSVTFNDTAVNYTVPVTRTEENIRYLTEIVDIDNTFGTNDILVADCQNGTLWLNNSQETVGNGTERPDLGALGNDWEQFTLEKGVNQIGAFYSEWVADEYKPTFKLRYRERFL